MKRVSKCLECLRWWDGPFLGHCMLKIFRTLTSECMYPFRMTKLKHRGSSSLSRVSKIMLIKYNILGRTISGIFFHHFLNVYQYRGMENFGRIKTKWVTTHKYQEPDPQWNFGFSAAKENFQAVSSSQFWSGKALYNSKCPIL